MIRWYRDKVVLKSRPVPVAIPQPTRTSLETESVPAAAALAASTMPAASSPLTTDIAPEQKTVACPFCQHIQPASADGLSVFCKNCNRRINLEGLNNRYKALETSRPSLRSIRCPSCQATQQVPSNALSAFCNKCGKRINMQDYQIRGKFNGDIQTRGTLTVALGGDVHADVWVGNAVIEGKLFGKLRADGKVEIRSTGYVEGEISAQTIVVHDGATLLGQCSTNTPPP